MIHFILTEQIRFYHLPLVSYCQEQREGFTVTPAHGKFMKSAYPLVDLTSLTLCQL